MSKNQIHKVSLTRVVLPLTEGGSPHLSFELSPKELFALGQANVQWAYLEHLVMEVTLTVSSALGITAPEGATQDSFRRRLAAFRYVAAAIRERNESALLVKVADRIAKANAFRQKLAHGIWSYDTADPEILHVEVSRREGGPSEYFNAERIIRFAEEVSAISFQLRYPGGKDQFLAERAEVGHGMSRELMKMLHGKPSLMDDLAKGSKMVGKT